MIWSRFVDLTEIEVHFKKEMMLSFNVRHLKVRQAILRPPANVQINLPLRI